MKALTAGILTVAVICGLSFSYYYLIQKPRTDRQMVEIEQQKLAIMESERETASAEAPAANSESVSADLESLKQQIEAERLQLQNERAAYEARIAAQEKRLNASASADREAALKAETARQLKEADERRTKAAAEYDAQIQREKAEYEQQQAQKKLEACLDQVEKDAKAEYMDVCVDNVSYGVNSNPCKGDFAGWYMDAQNRKYDSLRQNCYRLYQ